MFAQGSQLAQVRPSASASTAFVATLRTEVTQIVVANTTGSAASYSIYHDEDGTTYDQTTALFYAVSLSANATFQIVSQAMGGGIMLGRGAALGVKSSTDQAITFTIYGVTEELAPR